MPVTLESLLIGTKGIIISKYTFLQQQTHQLLVIMVPKHRQISITKLTLKYVILKR
jgi:hypothetical protein